MASRCASDNPRSASAASAPFCRSASMSASPAATIFGQKPHARAARTATSQNLADQAAGKAAASSHRARFAAASEKIDEVEQALHIAMQSADDVASRL